MAKYKKIVTTESGLALLENAAYLEGGSVQFVALKTGSGSYDGTEDLAKLTDLKEVRQTFGIESVTKKDSGLTVRIVLNNNDLTEGYNITEIGLYAKDPETGAEVLYAVIVSETGNEDFFPAYSDIPTSMTLEMYMVLTGAMEGVTFTAAPVEGVYVAAETFTEYQASVDEKIANLIAGQTRIEVGGTEPESGPVLWFNTEYKNNTEPEIATVLMLDLGDLAEDSVVQAEIEGTGYAVLNASDPVKVDDGVSIEIN